MLLFCDEGGSLVAEHRLCKDKGKLIKNNHHRRDTSQSVREIQKATLLMLGDTLAAQQLYNGPRKQDKKMNKIRWLKNESNKTTSHA